MIDWQQIKTSESPFISALSSFNNPYVSSIFNIVIISAAFSTFVGALFAITNVVVSLAKDHEAPKILMKENKRGVHSIGLLLGACGLLITILLSLLLPETLYEYVTTAAGVLLIGNWIIILASQIKNRKNYLLLQKDKSKRFTMYLAPYSSYAGIVLVILTIVGATINHTQRIGLFISLGIVAIISLTYVLLRPTIRRNKTIN